MFYIGQPYLVKTKTLSSNTTIFVQREKHVHVLLNEGIFIVHIQVHVHINENIFWGGQLVLTCK